MRLSRPSSPALLMLLGVLSVVSCDSLAYVAADVGDDLRIEVMKRGAGKQVVMLQGAREWFMLIDVTPENAVIIRQEKDHDRYLVDESETHDRPMSAEEVDAAISEYVKSIKAYIQKN